MWSCFMLPLSVGFRCAVYLGHAHLLVSQGLCVRRQHSPMATLNAVQRTQPGLLSPDNSLDDRERQSPCPLLESPK